LFHRGMRYPFINEKVVKLLFMKCENYDAAIPRRDDGFLERMDRISVEFHRGYDHIISRLMAKEKLDEWNIEKIRIGIVKYHNIDPISFEIAQPDRMEEILDEMVRRGVIRAKTFQGKKSGHMKELKLMKADIAIIGGTGVYDTAMLDNIQEV